MSPATAIGMLDRALARDGETITITHPVQGGDAQTQAVRAFLRGYRPEELSDDISQYDSLAILSPTVLAFLPQKLDRATVQGRVRLIGQVDTVMVADTVVRIEMQVRG